MSTAIDHPSHYNAAKTILPDGTAKYEAIKVIRVWRLGFSLGNAVKYILRAPHKGTELEDLEKALWYLDDAMKFPVTVINAYSRVIPLFSAATVAEDWGLPEPMQHVLYLIELLRTEEAHSLLESHIRARS